MNQKMYSSKMSAVKVILAINIAVFVMQSIAPTLTDELTVSAVKLENGKYWTLFTSMFAHGGMMHLFLNMYGLWIFGQFTESVLGVKRFITLYLVSGLLGTGLWLAFKWNLNLLTVRDPSQQLLHYLQQIQPEALRLESLGFSTDHLYIITNPTPMLGASAALFGVITAAAIIAPQIRLKLLIPPVELSLKTFAICYIILEIFLAGGSFSGDHVAHLAHLGGALGGIIFCFGKLRTHISRRQKKSNFHKKVKQAERNVLHRCEICGVTEKDDPDMMFRVCAQCGKEFCMNHLSPHPHGKSDSE